jgi:hypothetical protein
MGWEMMVLIIVGGILYKLKSIRIDFTGKDNDDDEPKKPKQIKKNNQRKQLKK